MATAAAAAAAAPAGQPATPDPLSGAMPTLAPSDVHVLLVDDERLSRLVVGNVLRKCAYRVTVAESGSEAVALLRAQPPGTFHLVLTDVMMPDVDGIELLRFLRGNDAFAAVPVVMMSANEENDTVFECIRGGAEDYLLKPVTRKEVQHIWQHVWRRQQQLVVPGIPDEAEELRRPSGPVSVPMAAPDIGMPAASAGLAQHAMLPQLASPAAQQAAQAAAPGDGRQPSAAERQWQSQLQPAAAQRQQQHQQLPQHQKGLQQRQPNAPLGGATQLPPQLPPSRPLAEFLSAAAGGPQQHSGEEAFRVLCQVLGFLRAHHAKGAALGRLRPSGLRVTGSCIVLLDPAAPIPADEEELYAAPEQLCARAQPPSAASGDGSVHSSRSPGGALAARAARAASQGLPSSNDSLTSASAVPAPGATGRLPSGALPALPGRGSPPQGGSASPTPQRTPAGDMFSLGLLLLQLLHPLGGSTSGSTGSGSAGASSDTAADAGAGQARRMLQDARHQILPSSLVQGRPAEAALLTALLSHDPKRRPAIDDVLRSGLLRKLHAGLTKRPAKAAGQHEGPPAKSAAAAGPGPSSAGPSAGSLAPAGLVEPEAPAAAASSLQLLTPQPQPQRQLIAESGLQHIAGGRSAAGLPAGALAAHLGSGGVLQDFLQLARESVAKDAAQLAAQISVLDQDAATTQRCLAAVQAQAAALEQRRAAASRRRHAVSEQVAPASSLTEAGQAATTSLQIASAPAVSTPVSTDSAETTSPVAAAATTTRSDEHAASTPPGSRKRSRGSAAATAVSPGAAVVAQPPDMATAAKARRVATALPAVDAAFFRAREAADAGSSNELSPTSQQAAASRSLQAALQPWRPDSSGGAPADDPAQLPPHLQTFGRDLDRFSRHGDFRVVAHLRYGDGLASPEMVCSTAFDRDDEFFATAGVSRHIKVYEFASLLEDGGAGAAGGAHYPVLDLPFRAKLAAVTWNTYLKSHLLAADYAGIATLVDASAGVEVAAFAEHTKRIWSVDFSATDPQRFLSGSDDGTVRLWSINDQNAAAAIDAKANVCSVQFSPTDANLMAFGGANYRTYLYDLRHIQSPLAVIGGHSRAVSYVRFMADGRRLLTASTDSALKLWDIAAEMARPIGQPAAPQLTYTGHVNEKNFVGLSVTPAGYIATGSEDNCVVAYHASIPVPIARHCFSEHGRQPAPRGAGLPGGEQFVSSLCWTRAGGAAVASNSQGHLRVLELV